MSDSAATTKLNLEEAVKNLSVSPPTIYYKLQKAMREPDTEFEDYARIINSDPSLVARLLKVVNSPFYGLVAKVETIPHAITIVGIDKLANLALATGVLTQFRGLPIDLVNMDRFWTHSIACALAAREIGKVIGQPNPERFYVAGMLHDLGKLIIYQKWPDQAVETFTRFYAGGKSMPQIETDILGFNHTDVARALLRAWKIPDTLIEGVAYHHHPQRARLLPIMPAVVHLADAMAYEMKLGNSGEPASPVLDPVAFKILKIDDAALNPVRDGLGEKVDETVRILL